MTKSEQKKYIVAYGADNNCAFNAFILAAADCIIAGGLDYSEDCNTFVMSSRKVAQKKWQDFFNNHKIQGKENWDFAQIKIFFKQFCTYQKQLELQHQFCSFLRNASYHYHIEHIANYVKRYEIAFLNAYEYHTKAVLRIQQNVPAEDIFLRCSELVKKFDEIREATSLTAEKNYFSAEIIQNLKEYWKSIGALIFLEHMNKSGSWAGDIELIPLAEIFGFALKINETSYGDFGTFPVNELQISSDEMADVLTGLVNRGIISGIDDPKFNEIDAENLKKRLDEFTNILNKYEKACFLSYPEAFNENVLKQLLPGIIQALKDRNLVTVKDGRNIPAPEITTEELHKRLKEIAHQSDIIAIYNRNYCPKPKLELVNRNASHWDCYTSQDWLKHLTYLPDDLADENSDSDSAENKATVSQPGYLTSISFNEEYKVFAVGSKWQNIPMFAVITGENGAGKTRLLEAIQRVVQADMIKKIPVLQLDKDDDDEDPEDYAAMTPSKHLEDAAEEKEREKLKLTIREAQELTNEVKGISTVFRKDKENEIIEICSFSSARDLHPPAIYPEGVIRQKINVWLSALEEYSFSQQQNEPSELKDFPYLKKLYENVQKTAKTVKIKNHKEFFKEIKIQLKKMLQDHLASFIDLKNFLPLLAKKLTAQENKQEEELDKINQHLASKKFKYRLAIKNKSTNENIFYHTKKYSILNFWCLKNRDDNSNLELDLDILSPGEELILKIAL